MTKQTEQAVRDNVQVFKAEVFKAEKERLINNVISTGNTAAAKMSRFSDALKQLANNFTNLETSIRNVYCKTKRLKGINKVVNK